MLLDENDSRKQDTGMIPGVWIYTLAGIVPVFFNYMGKSFERSYEINGLIFYRETSIIRTEVRFGTRTGGVQWTGII